MKRVIPVLLIGSTVFTGAIWGYGQITSHNKDDQNPDSNIIPIAVPVSAPVSDPITKPETIEKSVQETTQKEKWSHEYLPGFSIEIPDDWEKNVKEFNQPSEGIFSPTYFSECNENCMGLSLAKDGIELHLIFDVVLGDYGNYCSNTNGFELLDNDWARITTSEGYMYTTNLVPSKTITEEDASGYAIVDGVERYDLIGQTFSYCDYQTGNILIEEPNPSTTEAGAIMLEKPTIIGNPSAEILQQIDEMVLSISGIVGRADWVDKN